MILRDAGPLVFEPAFFERIWGGRRLVEFYDERLPAGKLIGEAWLLSDHAVHESRVSQGPLAGMTLRELMRREPDALLGERPRPARNGRFPLLLKIIDAAQDLSVQVHPDDACAERLGESDGGKTEMWRVLRADSGSQLICGLDSSIPAADFPKLARSGAIAKRLSPIEVAPGDAVFVPAGTVHAIGEGIVLAEIQQNSDVTYRIYDWDRLDSSGKPRELHVDKAAAAIRFGSAHAGKTKPLRWDDRGLTRSVLAVCPYFAAEEAVIKGRHLFEIPRDSFRVVLAISGAIEVKTESGAAQLTPGVCALIPGWRRAFSVDGEGAILLYYVPDLTKDIETPLRAAGHPPQAIAALGGYL